MSVDLARPDRVTTQFMAIPIAEPRRLPSVRDALGVAVRGLLVGVGIALVLIAGSSGGAILAAGLLALGAALSSWGE